jgi:hypothetical protein
MSVERMRIEASHTLTLNEWMSERWGAFPPYAMVGITTHTARWREHLCCECMCIIRIGQKYQRIVYRDIERSQLAQYKVHNQCPTWRFGL